jgi:uncharacterized protein
MASIASRDELFLDTVFAIALSNPNDQYHAQAVALSREIKRLAVVLVTTRAVMLEVGNALSVARFRPSGVRLLHSLENDKRVTILPVSESLYQEGLELFSSRPDKEWGLVDCISFVVMGERDLTMALTADQHFEQAGFVALLL